MDHKVDQIGHQRSVGPGVCLLLLHLVLWDTRSSTFFFTLAKVDVLAKDPTVPDEVGAELDTVQVVGVGALVVEPHLLQLLPILAWSGWQSDCCEEENDEFVVDDNGDDEEESDDDDG